MISGAVAPPAVFLLWGNDEASDDDLTAAARAAQAADVIAAKSGGLDEPVEDSRPVIDRWLKAMPAYNELNLKAARESMVLLKNDGILPLNDAAFTDESLAGHSKTVAVIGGSAEAARLAQQEDSLVTNFIVENFDNVLGPGVFMMMTSGYPYPVLTPQIEDIMSKATKKFKDDPYVKEYYRTANEIQARENGLVDDTQIAPPAEAATIQPPHTLPDSMHVPLTNLPQK